MKNMDDLLRALEDWQSLNLHFLEKEFHLFNYNTVYSIDTDEYSIRPGSTANGQPKVDCYGPIGFTMYKNEDDNYTTVVMHDSAANEIDPETDGFVKNHKLYVKSLKPEIVDNKTLDNPLIDVDGLSQKEINSIMETLMDKKIFSSYDKVNNSIVVLPAFLGDTENVDLSELSQFSGRLYYPTTSDDTVPKGSHHSYLHQNKMDIFTESGTPIGSVDAVKIMSDTPTYLNKDLIDSLPNVDPGTTDVTNQVLRSQSMNAKAFDRIKEAYSNGSVDELLNNATFINAWKSRDYDTIKSELGLFKDDKISESLEVLYGIRSRDLDNIIKLHENPISLDNGKEVYDIFKDPNVDNLSKAKLFSDEYVKYNDYNDVRYNMFTSRGERMYASGDDNYQSNTTIRENLRFKPVDSSDIDKDQYKDSLLQTIGGSLVEDGYIDTPNIKYTGDELKELAKKYISYGYDFENLTPRLKSQMRAYRNIDDFNVVDTGLSTTLDATFSGLAVNSAITGKTDNVGMINIREDKDDSDYTAMNDLYSDVGSELIDELVKLGVDRKKARKLVKPGVMTAMYNSSENRRTKLLTQSLREALSEYTSDVDGAIEKLKPSIRKTTGGATEVLSGTIRENDVMDLIDKGIIEVYKSDNGMPVPYDPKEVVDMVSNTAGIKINKPDGTHSTIMNSSDSMEYRDGVLRATGNDHVKPFVDTQKIKDGKYVESVNNKKFLDNVSTAIARSYDSYVASYVVEKLHKEGIPVMTTHDAFTVPVYAQERVKELYNEAINNLYKFGGSDKTVNARNNLSVE